MPTQQVECGQLFPVGRVLYPTFFKMSGIKPNLQKIFRFNNAEQTHSPMQLSVVYEHQSSPRQQPQQRRIDRLRLFHQRHVPALRDNLNACIGNSARHFTIGFGWRVHIFIAA